MRHAIPLIALTIAGAPAAARAEEDGLRPGERPANILSVAPLGWVGGLLAVEYERALSKHISFTFAPDVRFWNPREGDVFAASVPFEGRNIIGGSVGLRLFMLGRAPDGIWLQPEAGGVVGFTAVGGERVHTLAMPRIAFTGGLTYLLDGWLALSAGVGVQHMRVLMPNVRLSVGVGF